jgi:hypothetical protein
MISRWLEDLVEEPLRRAFAPFGSVELIPIDDINFGGWLYAQAFLNVVQRIQEGHSQPPPDTIYDLLSHSAQSAWDRLMSPRIFWALPLAARYPLAGVVSAVREGPRETEAVADCAALLSEALRSKEITMDMGEGQCWCYGDAVLSDALAPLVGAKTLARPYPGMGVRRLSGLGFREILRLFDPATRTFDKEGMAKVRTTCIFASFYFLYCRNIEK